MENKIHHRAAWEQLSAEAWEVETRAVELAKEVSRDLDAVDAGVRELEGLLQLEESLVDICRTRQDITSFSKGLQQSKDLREG